jgi:hypothetical protein
MAGGRCRNLCRSLFTRLDISPLPCVYVFAVVNFIVSNGCFQTNSAVHNVNTRNKDHLHKPVASLSYFKKSVYCSGKKYLTVFQQVSEVL